MANTYADTVLLKAQAFLNNEKQNPELRMQNYGVLNAFMKDAQFTIPELAAIKQAEKRATEALMRKRTSFTTASAMSCDPTGEVGGSAAVNIAWNAITTQVKSATKIYSNNQVTKQQAFAWDLMEAERALWDALETAGATYLHANRTQVNVNSDGAGQNTWDASNFKMDVAAADVEKFYNYVQGEMARNNYNGNFYSIHSTMWNPHLRYTAAQGQGNSANLNFQYGMPSNFDMHWSNQITASGYNKNRQFIVPDKSLALLTWLDPINRQGIQKSDRTWTTMPSMFMPGVELQVFVKEACQDTTADGGATQDPVDIYEIGLWYSFNKAPLTNSGESVIFEYETA